MDGTHTSPVVKSDGTRFFRSPASMIEDRDTTFDQRISVDRWPDTLRASIRYRALLHAQLRRRIGHAA
jgi:hypothetical protein